MTTKPETFKFVQGSDRFLGVITTKDGVDVDPERVAITTTPVPPDRGSAEWLVPVGGIIRDTPRVGVMTGALLPATSYWVWALPPDPDEYAPVLACKVQMV